MKTKTTSDIPGIDVSHHQAAIDWKKVAASGVKFAIIKASEGKTYKDPMFVAHSDGARAAGIAVGFYHYARPENNSPEDEAANFYRATLGQAYQLPLVLDVEGDASKLGRAKLTAWCKTFCEQVEKLSGHDVMIYTGGSFAKTYLGSELNKYPLWIAHYGVITPMANTTWSDWSAFQYSSSGKVPGISGNVDMNVMLPAFYEKYTKPIVITPPVPPAPKLVKEDAEKIIRFLSAGWSVALSPADKAEFQRLANTLRDLAGIPQE